MKSERGIFITGTGTEVGKTAVSCAIARYWANRGHKVGVMKPIASGGIRRGKIFISDDAVALQKAARTQDQIELINPVCFKHPLAPYSASILEKKSINWKKVRTSFNQLKNQSERLLVEGVGGALVPLDMHTDVTGLIKQMNLPVIVVALAALGTINHTLLTLEILKQKKIRVLGIILNHFDKSGLADRTNAAFFKRRKVPVLATIPSDKKFAKDFDFAARQIQSHPQLKKILG